jgi:nitrogenase-stabilizing/protective protein
MSALPDELKGLDTAEDFLSYFHIPFDRRVVDVNRLHILQRFHDYVASTEIPTADPTARLEQVRSLLQRAYDDFIQSTPLTERVFKVLKDRRPDGVAPGKAFVPLSAVKGIPPRRDT